jgi:hypothetical protein
MSREKGPRRTSLLEPMSLASMLENLHIYDLSPARGPMAETCGHTSPVRAWDMSESGRLLYSASRL